MIASARADAPAPGTGANNQAADQGTPGQIKVSVSLDDSLKDRVDAGDTVFVFARALNGPPMPLAVVRKRATELPLEVTLDDSMAMVPQLKLSGQEAIAVVARVSKSGDARVQKGDLIGEVTPVATVEGNSVDVVISRQVN
jgi:cytochrome c-type biogenesis protein CcmH